MRRGWLVAGAAALVGLWVLMRPSSEGPDVPVRATPPPVVALVVSRHPSLALLGDLGLDDAERYSLTVLDTGTRDLLIVYPEGVDPIETAARWSLVVVQAGYRKTNDWSRPGRTVLRFADEEMSVLLAVGRTTKAPSSCVHTRLAASIGRSSQTTRRRVCCCRSCRRTLRRRATFPSGSSAVSAGRNRPAAHRH